MSAGLSDMEATYDTGSRPGVGLDADRRTDPYAFLRTAFRRRH